QGASEAGREEGVGTPRTWAPQEVRARPGALRQRPPRDHRLDQSPGGRCPPRDPRFHRQDGAKSSRPRRPNGQSALYRLGQQLSSIEGLLARVCQSYEEGIRPWGGARESGGVSVFLAQAVLAGVSGPQQNKSPRIRGLLSIPPELSSAECVRAGGTDLTSGIRPSGREQSEKGRICPMPGPLRPSTNSDKLSDSNSPRTSPSISKRALWARVPCPTDLPPTIFSDPSVNEGISLFFAL